MTAPDAQRPGTARWCLAGIGLLAAGVTVALYVAGRLVQPDYTFSLFGANPIPAKSLLATIALALAVLQVLLALWMCTASCRCRARRAGCRWRTG